MKQITLLVLLLLVHAIGRSASHVPEPDSAFVSVITVLPGTAPEELFGHSALRIVDPDRRIDLLYNYGTFEFGRFFLLKFLIGNLDYSLGVESFSRSLVEDQLENRPVLEQKLNLTRAEQESVHCALVTNARAENRYYRYKFLKDNCTTRIPAVIMKAIHRDVEYSHIPDSNVTFRQAIQTYYEGYPFLGLAANILLGPPADRRMNPRDALFLPVNMMQAFDDATIVGPDIVRPLVASKDTVFWVPGYQRKASLPWASIVSWGLLVLGAYYTIRNYRANVTTKFYFDFIVFGIVGCLGILLTLLWIFSAHDIMKPNLNLLWAWPTHSIVVVLLFKRDSYHYFKLYFAGTLFACTGVILTWFLLPQRIDFAIFPLLLVMVLRSVAIIQNMKVTSVRRPAVPAA
jgi:hypothetical protein